MNEYDIAVNEDWKAERGLNFAFCADVSAFGRGSQDQSGDGAGDGDGDGKGDGFGCGMAEYGGSLGGGHGRDNAWLRLRWMPGM